MVTGQTLNSQILLSVYFLCLTLLNCMQQLWVGGALDAELGR